MRTDTVIASSSRGVHVTPIGDPTDTSDWTDGWPLDPLCVSQRGAGGDGGTESGDSPCSPPSAAAAPRHAQRGRRRWRQCGAATLRLRDYRARPIHEMAGGQPVCHSPLTRRFVRVGCRSLTVGRPVGSDGRTGAVGRAAEPSDGRMAKMGTLPHPWYRCHVDAVLLGWDACMGIALFLS